MRMIIVNEKKYHRAMYKKLEKQRNDEKRKFTEEKKNLINKYKTKLEQTRAVYSSYNEKMVNDIKMDQANMLSQLVKRYEEFAGKLFDQLEELHQLDYSRFSRQDVISNMSVAKESQSPSSQDRSITGRQENTDEKSLELERLKELELIGKMIKEIAQAREHEK